MGTRSIGSGSGGGSSGCSGVVVVVVVVVAAAAAAVAIAVEFQGMWLSGDFGTSSSSFAAIARRRQHGAAFKLKFVLNTSRNTARGLLFHVSGDIPLCSTITLKCRRIEAVAC